ncbi:MAG: hypothetical protein ABIL09_16115 [Gemmatimonadota bacterium]
MRKLYMSPTHLRDHLPELLARVAQEDIPLVVREGGDGPEMAAVVNAASLDRLIARAEAADALAAEPVQERYARHLEQWKGERRALLQQMEGLAGEIARACCPRCAARVRERWSGKGETLGEAWKAVTGGAVISSTAMEGGDCEGDPRGF